MAVRTLSSPQDNIADFHRTRTEESATPRNAAVAFECIVLFKFWHFFVLVLSTVSLSTSTVNALECQNNLVARRSISP